MVNYQLYRTNVLLGGQMKYDLVLNDSGYGLSIGDFHITPISNKVPYNKYIKDNLLNYTHSDNISRYYKNISGSFYKDFADVELTNLYPMVSTTNRNYDDTYECGCRRMNYELYNKQFSYLCPLWIEQIKNDECLMFEFNMYTEPSQTKKLSSKFLYMDLFSSNYNDVAYHNKFVSYFNKYLTNIGCDYGNDWVINIKEDVSLINGVDVETGASKISKSRFIYQNLTSRERPLLEQNNILINELPNNKLITKQLINFNFCFNLLDLCKLSSTRSLLDGQLLGKNLYVEVKVYICDKESKEVISELELRDLFSNHDYIKKIRCNSNKINLEYDGKDLKVKAINLSDDSDKQGDYTNPTDELNELNVLSYLQDYNCIDLIDKNKIVQNTIHWSTVDSPEITFNFYNGFSGYLEHLGEKIMLKNTNAYTPDTDLSEYNPYLNQYWCNSIKLECDYTEDHELYHSNRNTYIEFAKKLINDPSKYADLFSKFSKECVVKNVKYKYVEEHLIDDIDKITIHTLIIENNMRFIMNDNVIEDINVVYHPFNNSDSGFYLICDKKDSNYVKNYIIFVHNSDMDNLPLSKSITALNSFIEYAGTQELSSNLRSICDFIVAFINIAKNKTSNDHVYVTIPASLDAQIISGPSLSVKEFEYFKNNNNKFIERNIGKIKPTFIDTKSEYFFNFKFSKLSLEDVKSIPKYLTYQKLGFPAKYPSINFCPFKKELQTYQADETLSTKIEYNKFNYNKLLNLSNDISTSIISSKNENGQYPLLQNLIDDYIKSLYNIEDDNIFQYILSLYNYSYDFEYLSDKWDPSKGPDYIYNVKIKLK